MYKCNECGCKFEEVRKMHIEEFYGIDVQTNEKISLCPNCESNDIEELSNYEL